MKTIKVKTYSEIPANYTGIAVQPNGDKYWLLNGQLHKEDGPAVQNGAGDRFWYTNNKLHRENGPAIEYSDGEKRWLFNGKLHREDGPAIECVNGTKYWCRNGKELSGSKIQQLLDLGYPMKTAIKLVYFYENNKNR